MFIVNKKIPLFQETAPCRGTVCNAEEGLPCGNEMCHTTTTTQTTTEMSTMTTKMTTSWPRIELTTVKNNTKFVNV